VHEARRSSHEVWGKRVTTKSMLLMRTTRAAELGARVGARWGEQIRRAPLDIRPTRGDVCTVDADQPEAEYACMLLAHFADSSAAARWREWCADDGGDPWLDAGVADLLVGPPTTLWVDVREGRGGAWLAEHLAPGAPPLFTTFELLRRRDDIDGEEFARLWWEHKLVADRVLAGQPRAPAYVQNLVRDVEGPDHWDGVAEVSRDDAAWARPSEWFDRGAGAEIAAHEALFLDRTALRFVRTRRRPIDGGEDQ
jgi:hypothetical protein